MKQVKKTDLKARYLFLSPPSLEVLEQRLTGRGTESKEAVEKRLKQAKVEMEFSKTPGVHDKIIVNDDLDTAYKEMSEWILDGGKFGGEVGQA